MDDDDGDDDDDDDVDPSSGGENDAPPRPHDDDGGGRMVPVIVFSSTTSHLRSRLRAMGVDLRLLSSPRGGKHREGGAPTSCFPKVSSATPMTAIRRPPSGGGRGVGRTGR